MNKSSYFEEILTIWINDFREKDYSISEIGIKDNLNQTISLKYRPREKKRAGELELAPGDLPPLRFAPLRHLAGEVQYVLYTESSCV